MTSAASTASLPVENVDLSTLKPHPDNPRNGDVDAIAESIRANGLYKPLVVQRSTGHVLAGNHTYAALLSLGETSAPAVVLDVDDDHARRILLADNRTADLSRYDDALLADLLQTVNESSGLAGTGYDLDALDDLLATLERDAARPLDAPDGPRGYAETDEEEEDRAADRGNDSIHASGLREMVLVFDLDTHAKMLRLLKHVRTGLHLGEQTASQTVLTCVEAMADRIDSGLAGVGEPFPKRS